jgi:hypothetical protein
LDGFRYRAKIADQAALPRQRGTFTCQPMTQFGTADMDAIDPKGILLVEG